jgi:uncharacterized protein YdaT
MKKNVHVVPSNSGWGVKKEGNSKNTANTETKKEAIKVATDIAKNEKTEVVIHGKDGKIQGKNSHGNDSFPPKG